MAEVTVQNPKPTVTLKLTWDEFAAVTASVAVGDPKRVVDYLGTCGCGDSPIAGTVELARITGPLFRVLFDNLRSGGR